MKFAWSHNILISNKFLKQIVSKKFNDVNLVTDPD